MKPTQKMTLEEKKAKKLAAFEKKVAAKKQRKYNPRQLMKAGSRHGNLILLQRVRPPAKCSPATKKRWRCRCVAEIELHGGEIQICNKELTIPEMYLRRRDNPKLDCGAHKGSLRSKYNNEYRIWLMIRERTRNADHIANKHYVSRGIDIIDEWYDLETGFEKYFLETGPRPSKEHSIDRIDNNLGYMHENLRWATSAQQRANQGDMVAGYLEEDIIKAGYTRDEFRRLVHRGNDEHELIAQGKNE